MPIQLERKQSEPISADDYVTSRLTQMKETEIDKIYKSIVQSYPAAVLETPQMKNFLIYLQANKKEIVNVIRQGNVELRINDEDANSKLKLESYVWGVAGVIIGLKYVASVYFNAAPSFDPASKLRIIIDDNRFTTDSIRGPLTSYTNVRFAEKLKEGFSQTEIFMDGLSSSIHEGTHSLPLMAGRKGVLNELATALTSIEIIPPFFVDIGDKSDKERWARGHRDEVASSDFGIYTDRLVNGTRQFLRIPKFPNAFGFKDEYFNYLLAPYVKGYYQSKGKAPNIWEYIDPLLGRPESVYEALNLMDANSLLLKSGISDSDVKQRLKAALDESFVQIRKASAVLSFEQKLELVEKALEKYFGKPYIQELPPGYGMLQDQPNLKNVLPKKNLG